MLRLISFFFLAVVRLISFVLLCHLWQYIVLPLVLMPLPPRRFQDMQEL
jgi:hypothetical protein